MDFQIEQKNFHCYSRTAQNLLHPVPSFSPLSLSIQHRYYVFVLHSKWECRRSSWREEEKRENQQSKWRQRVGSGWKKRGIRNEFFPPFHSPIFRSPTFVPTSLLLSFLVSGVLWTKRNEKEAKDVLGMKNGNMYKNLIFKSSLIPLCWSSILGFLLYHFLFFSPPLESHDSIATFFAHFHRWSSSLCFLLLSYVMMLCISSKLVKSKTMNKELAPTLHKFISLSPLEQLHTRILAWIRFQNLKQRDVFDLEQTWATLNRV